MIDNDYWLLLPIGDLDIPLNLSALFQPNIGMMLGGVEQKSFEGYKYFLRPESVLIVLTGVPF